MTNHSYHCHTSKSMKHEKMWKVVFTKQKEKGYIKYIILNSLAHMTILEIIHLNLSISAWHQ